MDKITEPTIIIIVGPTGVGKTALAIELAKHFNTEIISADSRQCFKEMNIGVARPTEKELSEVKHHFIASHSVAENLNAGNFEKYALSTVTEIFKKNNIAIMVGGTGLYIKAFCEGIDPIPIVPDEVRLKVTEGYAQKGLIWLQKELEQKDPDFWEVAEKQNPQRLMRALEVLYATGQSIMIYRTAKKVVRPFRIIKIGLEMPKEALHNRLNQRVDQMILDGLVDEVRSLVPFKSQNALLTVGYRELFDCMDRNSSLEEAIEKIKINTRQYAKRQMTWFVKDKEIIWFESSPDSIQLVIDQL